MRYVIPGILLLLLMAPASSGAGHSSHGQPDPVRTTFSIELFISSETPWRVVTQVDCHLDSSRSVEDVREAGPRAVEGPAGTSRRIVLVCEGQPPADTFFELVHLRA